MTVVDDIRIGEAYRGVITGIPGVKLFKPLEVDFYEEDELFGTNHYVPDTNSVARGKLGVGFDSDGETLPDALNGLVRELWGFQTRLQEALHLARECGGDLEPEDLAVLQYLDSIMEGKPDEGYLGFSELRNQSSYFWEGPGIGEIDGHPDLKLNKPLEILISQGERYATANHTLPSLQGGEILEGYGNDENLASRHLMEQLIERRTDLIGNGELGLTSTPGLQRAYLDSIFRED